VLPQVLELKEQDVDVATVLADNMRMQLYEGHVAEVLSSGAGPSVDAERLLHTLPQDLKIDVAKAAGKAREAAKGKARSVLVQVRQQLQHGAPEPG
jgi:hypothetical protein